MLDFDCLLQEGTHRLSYGGVSFEFFIQGNFFNNPGAFLAGFHGAIRNKSKTVAPYFHFKGVSKAADIPLISFSDPSLEPKGNLNLAWFIGSERSKGLSGVIAKFLDEVILYTRSTAILSGGSGGGFAALNIHSKMTRQDASVSFVWNPQIRAYSYNDAFSKRYIDFCHGCSFKSEFKGVVAKKS